MPRNTAPKKPANRNTPTDRQERTNSDDRFYRINEMTHEQLLTAIRQRQEKRAVNHGEIVTADRFVSTLTSCVGDTCKRYLGDGIDVASAIKMSQDKLAFAPKEGDYQSKRFKEVEVDQLELPDGIELPDKTLLVVQHVLTTPKEDRDFDTLQTEGAQLDPKSPLLWQHIPVMPIGKVVGTVEHTPSVLRLVSVLLDLNDLTEDAAKLIEADALRFSHGFRALAFEERKADGDMTDIAGWNITKFEIMEASLVSVPSNTDAVIEMFSRGKLSSPMMKAWGQAMRDKTKKPQAQGTLFDAGDRLTPQDGRLAETKSSMSVDGVVINGALFVKNADGASVRQTRSNDPCVCDGKSDGQGRQGLPERKQCNHVMTKGQLIDIEREQLEASALEYDWCARHCGVQIKELRVVSTFASGVYKGGYLKALESIADEENWNLLDVRRLTCDGKEMPPIRELIQISSKASDTFLIDGLKFYNTPFGDIALKFEDGWCGESITVYAGNDEGPECLGRAWDWLSKNNPLKGEAFTLSGDFIERKGGTFDDVILPEKNKAPVQKAVELLNRRGADANNRGMILMGPPGTGKTLSGRCILNEAKATFIWIAAKDFWRMGATYGLIRAFDMANDLAPATIFIEDVDNWLSSTTIDVIKTEMDGIDKSSGVLTILTTNYPERLPKALIDRPGRFHDVCNYDVPGEGQRRTMLDRWLPGCEEKTTLELLKRTKGMSGAHLYELCDYAKQIAEDDELSLDVAATKAVDKIEEQRKLIDEVQLEGSRYQPTRSALKGKAIEIADEIKATRPLTGTVIKLDVDGLLNFEWSSDDDDADEKAQDFIRQLERQLPVETTKRGRALSAKNIAALKEVRDDIEELQEKESLTRGGNALCKRCIEKLNGMIDEGNDNDDDDDKSSGMDANEHAVEFIWKSNAQQRRALVESLKGMIAVDERDQQTRLFRETVKP